MTPELMKKDLCRLRTITTFIVLEKDVTTWEKTLSRAGEFCRNLSAKFQEQGYAVQSVRMVTNPFGQYLDTRSVDTAKAGLAVLTRLLNGPDMPDVRIRFAIGEAKTREEIALLPSLIKDYGDLCNACVNVGFDEYGFPDNTLVTHAAQAVREISRITNQGEGNFNFTVNFNCDPFIPYFPAGYHGNTHGDCFVIGLETPDLLVKTLESLPDRQDHNEGFKAAYDALAQALQYHVDKIAAVVQAFDRTDRFQFIGIDSSAAPSKECSSMVRVYELLGVEYFGAAGTVEASALLTRVFKSVSGVPLVGFSGLMLAVTEDMGLAKGTQRAQFDIRSLLTYSAVCGIGLDTVPIPGSTTIQKISALMRDTGIMAHRLNKPLTVRLFPVPGLNPGDITSFESDDLCNCAVLAVP
jgi:uncharacterized protein (UPF0210 family)